MGTAGGGNQVSHGALQILLTTLLPSCGKRSRMPRLASGEHLWSVTCCPCCTLTLFIATSSYDPETRPELANLLTIFSAVSGRSIPDLVGSFKVRRLSLVGCSLTSRVLCASQDSSMQQFKQELTDAVVSQFVLLGRACVGRAWCHSLAVACCASSVTPIGSEVQRLLGDPHYIDSVRAHV